MITTCFQNVYILFAHTHINILTNTLRTSDQLIQTEISFRVVFFYVLIIIDQISEIHNAIDYYNSMYQTSARYNRSFYFIGVFSL